MTLLYKNWGVRFPEQGVYRIDSDPPRLWVFQGRAEVSAGSNEALSVEQGMNVPFAPVLVPERSIDQPHDSLSLWAEGRQQSISADNAIAANIQDPASITTANSGYDTFTYFPVLGLPAVAPDLSSTYRSLATYQPGFNSIYLPGYTYQPFILGLLTVGHRPFPGSAVPHVPYPRPTPVRPVPHPIGGGHPVGGHPVGVHPIHR